MILATAKPDPDAEIPPEEARELLIKLLGASGAEWDAEKEKAEAEKAASDAVDKRPNAKPLLGDAKRSDPPMPTIGRGPRKKT